MVVLIRPPTCGLPVAILEFVVYRDPTGCLTTFYFSPFEVQDDSNPSGDGLPHLSWIKLGGAATLEYHAVGTLNLPVTLWVRHGGVADLYADLFAPIFKFRSGELCAVVRDDPVGNAKSDHNILEKFLGLGGCDRGDGFGFNPLGEFVDGDEEVCVTAERSLQGTDHVEAPDCERPSDWDGLQFLRWHVYLPSEILASFTFADEYIGICDSGWPKETLPVSLADQCS